MSEIQAHTFKYIDFEEMENEHDDIVDLGDVVDRLKGVGCEGDFGSVYIDVDDLDIYHEPEMRFVLTYLWNKYKHLFEDQIVVIGFVSEY